jgi:hypothetical protein
MTWSHPHHHPRHDVEPSQSSSIGPAGPRKEAKDDATLEALFLLALSLVTCTFSLTYKRGGRTPHREGKKKNPI